MNDQRNKLQEMFKESNRYANFGSILLYLNIKGFRCHNLTIIEIESPITAFCGLNGTGKSTILQLAAAAYKKADGDENRRFYIKDFIISGKLDPTPFTPDSSVEYGYWQENRTLKKVAINRRDPEKRWRYGNQPSRHVFFAGMGLYLPKIEVRDFIIRNASNITITSCNDLPNQSKQWACKILNCNYETMKDIEVKHENQSGFIVTVSRNGNTYSEANMGCGEGRVQYIIRTLETLPDKSLVLLEEPETSLHPSAQHEFGKYLVDVCIRKKHQVLITTHSEFILSALPSLSKIYLDNTPKTGISIIKGISTSQAKSLMTEGHDKALHILVEDDIAEAVLIEILRKADSTFLKTIIIHQIGDVEKIHSIMTALKNTSLPIAAVRDGDKEGNPKENIFKLPGELPPEKELLMNDSVKKYIFHEFNINIEDFLVTVKDIDHHQWFDNLSKLITINKDALVQQTSKIYVTSLQESEIDIIKDLLKAAIAK